MSSLATLVAPEPVKSDLLKKKVSESRQHSPPASPGPQLSSSSSSASSSSSVTDYSPPSPSSPSASAMDPPSPKAKPATPATPATATAEAANSNNNNNNFNVFIGRHQVSVVVLKHQGIGGKHPRDAGKFYYQARIRNEYPQRHIWSGWANREEVVQKISVLLKATPDTKIETVPTQNPSKRQNNDSASPASTRRQSVKRRQSSSNSITKADTSVSRRKASRGDDLADIAERMQKRARGSISSPTSSPPAATSAMNPQPQAVNTFPSTAPLQFSNLAYFAHVPHLYYPVYPQASAPAVGAAAGAAQNLATFQLLSLAAANMSYPHLQPYPALVPVAVESNPLAPTATPTAVPLMSPVASPATTATPPAAATATPPTPTSPTIRNSEMESLVILAGLERQQLDRAE